MLRNQLEAQVGQPWPREPHAPRRQEPPCGRDWTRDVCCASCTRSTYSSAVGSWVATSTVTPSCSTTRRNRARVCRPVALSSSPVGSSARIRSGRLASARPIPAARCARLTPRPPCQIWSMGQYFTLPQGGRLTRQPTCLVGPRHKLSHTILARG
jgi:hypothetical protein